MALSTLPETADISFPGVSSARTIYWTLLILILLVLTALPFITLDISVRSPGIIRPVSERTIVRSMMTGMIRNLYYKEGDYIEKDSLILDLRDNITQPKLDRIDFEMKKKLGFIRDLELLTNFIKDPGEGRPGLVTPLYLGQLSRYLFHLNDQTASIQKVTKELRSDSSLLKDKVISDKEFYDKKIESEKLNAVSEASKSEQLSTWQQQLSQLRSELTELQSARKQVLEERERYEVRAPVAGILQGLTGHYEGGFVQSGEAFCELSPETRLIAECFVPTRDAGFLYKNQPVTFQIDAYNHNYFGVIKGKIISVDNDFTVVDDLPVFKVRCEFDHNVVSLKNGYKSRLKKGLKLQARFMITQRSVLQLMFDQVDDWLNPVAF